MKLASTTNPFVEMDLRLIEVIRNTQDFADEIARMGRADRKVVSSEVANSLNAVIHLYNAEIEFYLPAATPKSDTEWLDLADVLSQQAEWMLAEAKLFRVSSDVISDRLKTLAEARLDAIPTVFAASLHPLATRSKLYDNPFVIAPLAPNAA